MTIFTHSIWEQVQQHSWKYRQRSAPIDALLWHCTRGGQNYDGYLETQAAINWFTSPANKIQDPRYPDYAGISNVLIGPDSIVEVVPLHLASAWSSHPSDEHAISIEVAQSNLNQPIEQATIENCIRFSAWAGLTYSIPTGRVYPVDDWHWTGEAGHEDTQQGRSQGKSDPGSLFWELYLGDNMADSRVDDIIKVLGDYQGWIARGNVPMIDAYAMEQDKLVNFVARVDAELARLSLGNQQAYALNDLIIIWRGILQVAVPGLMLP